MEKDPFKRIFGLETKDKPTINKDLILQGIKKELESIEHMGERVTSMGWIMRNADVHQKQLGEILEGMDFSEHIMNLNTLMNQLETFHKNKMRDVVAYYSHKEE